MMGDLMKQTATLGVMCLSGCLPSNTALIMLLDSCGSWSKRADRMLLECIIRLFLSSSMPYLA